MFTRKSCASNEQTPSLTKWPAANDCLNSRKSACKPTSTPSACSTFSSAHCRICLARATADQPAFSQSGKAAAATCTPNITAKNKQLPTRHTSCASARHARHAPTGRLAVGNDHHQLHNCSRKTRASAVAQLSITGLHQDGHASVQTAQPYHMHPTHSSPSTHTHPSPSDFTPKAGTYNRLMGRRTRWRSETS